MVPDIALPWAACEQVQPQDAQFSHVAGEVSDQNADLAGAPSHQLGAQQSEAGSSGFRASSGDNGPQLWILSERKAKGGMRKTEQTSVQARVWWRGQGSGDLPGSRSPTVTGCMPASALQEVKAELGA